MPVVAGDAIKRELGHGLPRDLAAWIGPSKLAKAIVFATITNIVAYLPFLLLTGDTSLLSVQPAGGDDGDAARVGDRLVHAADCLLLDQAAGARRPAHGRAARTVGFYYRVGDFALRHRWGVLVGSLGILAAGWMFMSRLNPQFFPKISYLSYVDVWLPPDARSARPTRPRRTQSASSGRNRHGSGRNITSTRS